MSILTLGLCHFEPRSCRWPKAGRESLQTNTTAATSLEFHTIKVPGRIYGDITPVCSLPAFYFTVFHLRTHTPPDQGRVGAMGRHTFGSFSASRKSWRAILRQCMKLCLLVNTSYQAYQHLKKKIRLTYLSKTLGFVGFCVLAAPGDRFRGF